MRIWTAPKIDRAADVWISPWDWKVVKPANFVLGEHTDIGSYTVILAQQGVIIEDDAQIGPHCAILSVSTIDGKQGQVTIKKNARVGAHTVIMPGVTVGENAIVGACSFVNRDIPTNEVWFGTPARFVRKS
jgi:acetyltransferase-like isoleucine patch superfamily enzyme